MGISLYKLRRWAQMLAGNSISHVNQGVGKVYSSSCIKGYYNDLTEKVTKQKELLETKQLPLVELENGEYIEFPTAIFQYGLGSYDLYISTHDDVYLNQFKLSLGWAINHQERNGAWNNFYYIYPKTPYCAMAQGEGISLLLRGYTELKDESFLLAARKAAIFMLTDVKLGGTSNYDGEDLILLEYTQKPAVLNGWIFALWGLYDLTKVDDTPDFRIAYDRTIATLVKYLPNFSKSYWSKYNLEGLIASPFYHSLHIAQMTVLYDLTGFEEFKQFATRWENNKNNFFIKTFAFVEKSLQKILEK